MTDSAEQVSHQLLHGETQSLSLLPRSVPVRCPRSIKESAVLQSRQDLCLTCRGLLWQPDPDRFAVHHVALRGPLFWDPSPGLLLYKTNLDWLLRIIVELLR